MLDVYAKPYDAGRPVLCMDEQPVQLVRETRRPVAATRHHPRRLDDEYERAGTASIFLFCEPLAGWAVDDRARAAPRPTGLGRWPPCSKGDTAIASGSRW